MRWPLSVPRGKHRWRIGDGIAEERAVGKLIAEAELYGKLFVSRENVS
jgi:hypothetical protein